MSERRTRCSACGVEIQQWTADRNGGLCAPCHMARMRPAECEIPDDLAARLSAVGEDLEALRPLAADREYLESVAAAGEDRQRLIRTWTPRIRAFAEACRRALPPPAEASLSAKERAQQAIYEASLAGFADRTGDEAALCSMPLLAVAVARRLWPGDDPRLVALTPEELDRWDDLHGQDYEPFSWYSRHSWRIKERSVPPGPPELEDFRRRWGMSLRTGEARWYVEMHHGYGPRAGFGGTEEWIWDGRDARFVRRHLSLIS